MHWFLFFLSLPVLLCPETAAVVQNGLLRVFAVLYDVFPELYVADNDGSGYVTFKNVSDDD